MAKIYWPGIGEKVGEGVDSDILVIHPIDDETLEEFAERWNEIGERYDISAEDLRYALNNKQGGLNMAQQIFEPGDILKNLKEAPDYQYLVLEVNERLVAPGVTIHSYQVLMKNREFPIYQAGEVEDAFGELEKIGHIDISGFTTWIEEGSEDDNTDAE